MSETDAERADRFQRERDVAIDQRDRALIAASVLRHAQLTDIERLHGLLSRALDVIGDGYESDRSLQQLILDELANAGD